ncbi:DUF2063 domain-containing protein [Phragmitibacter flavus]|uniref:DUF2063 domain-containing protein n=1 Tax=Phragmitibacter flavus TaxID=2576071 RepID=A0A5R8KBV2_9BACT|nr:DNA-binding domain-containing protein [Phragmitibacter flavus]TLD69778.1 DUF2063 domain-containing protein [Phragmitibacter flavus]
MKTPYCPSDIDSLQGLAEVQRLMAHAVMRPLAADEGMRRTWEDGKRTRSVVASFMKGNEQMNGFDRLEIYNRQYWFRLLDCLYEDYPGLRVLLGQRRFQRMCVAYLSKCPSQSFTLRNLGSRLEEFLRAEPVWTGELQSMAVDVARFEWAQTVAFDEAKRPALKVDELLGKNLDELCLRLQPYVVLLELDHAVDVYFMAVRKFESGMRKEASHAMTGESRKKVRRKVKLPVRERVHLVVHRCDNDLYFLRLEKEAFLLLEALGRGDGLARALDLALADADGAMDWMVKVRGWFEQWAALGWFCK